MDFLVKMIPVQFDKHVERFDKHMELLKERLHERMDTLNVQFRKDIERLEADIRECRGEASSFTWARVSQVVMTVGGVSMALGLGLYKF